MKPSATELPNMIPWWILPMIGKDHQLSGIDAGLFVDSLDRVLDNWSRHIGIHQIHSGRWWHVESFFAAPPKTPEELLNNLGSYCVNPLQGSFISPPKISGDIDASQLRIALIGSVCDPTTRTYLHSLGKLLRWRSHTIFGPRSLKLIAYLYLPDNANQRKDKAEIARFLSELDLLMKQSSGDRPFDIVFFFQDSNVSYTNNRAGYQFLNPSQITDLLVQNLFHLMIGESRYLDEQMNKEWPTYMAAGSVALYYDLHQHRQMLATQAATKLLQKFSTAKDPPFVNNEEAEVAAAQVESKISSQQLLIELSQIVRDFETLHTPFSEARREESMDAEIHPEASDSLKERLNYIHRELLERTESFWSGNDTVAVGRITLIKGMQEIFYGSGHARSLEQALLALRNLKARYSDLDHRAAIEQLKNPDWWEQSGLEKFLKTAQPYDLKQQNDTETTFSAITPLPLLLIGLEFGLLAGLSTLLSVGGYFFYRRLRRRVETLTGELKELEEMTKEMYETRPALEKEKLRRVVSHRIEPVFEIFIHNAQQLVEHLEVYISNVRENVKQMEAKPPLDEAFSSTTFFRSVLEDWQVPWRTISTPMMSADLLALDSFAPPLNVDNRQVKFADCGEGDLHFLVNQLFEKNRSASDLIIPDNIRYTDKEITPSSKTSQNSAANVARIFGSYGRQLYEDMSYSMNDALKHVFGRMGKGKFLELLKQMAAPPLIASAASPELVPLHFEWKYHDPKRLKNLLNGSVVEHIRHANEGYSSIPSRDVLSVALYQPIQVNDGSGAATLSAIHTIRELQSALPDRWHFSTASQMAASPSLMLTLAASPNEALPANIDVGNLKGFHQLKDLLNKDDFWQLDRYESKASPQLMWEDAGLELHLKVTFDEQADPNHLFVGEKVRMHIAPSRFVEPDVPYPGRTREPRFRVEEVAVMVWFTDAEVEPSWQILKLNEPFDQPLTFNITPKAEGQFEITIMILVRNEPVYEAAIPCKVFSRAQLEGLKETIHFGPQPEPSPVAATIKKNDGSRFDDHDEPQEDE